MASFLDVALLLLFMLTAYAASSAPARPCRTLCFPFLGWLPFLATREAPTREFTEVLPRTIVTLT